MADTKKAQATAEPNSENEMIQAARAWVKTLNEAGAAVAETALALQDRNVRFTQSVVDQSLKQIEDQTATLRKLYGDLASQTDAPRAALRDLSREAAEAYVGLLTAPVRFARRAAETIQEAVERGVEE